jgi:hypothetical protein
VPIYDLSEGGLQALDNDLFCLDVLTAVSMKMAVFWAVAPCRLV